MNVAITINDIYRIINIYIYVSYLEGSDEEDDWIECYLFVVVLCYEAMVQEHQNEKGTDYYHYPLSMEVLNSNSLYLIVSDNTP